MTAARRLQDPDAVLAYVAEQTGLVFPGARRLDFERGATRVMRRHGIREPRALASHLRLDRRLLDELVAEVAVHESYFFREPAQFQAIRELVLPRLLRERAPDARLQAWSAGCARGEEPYSLAILLEQEGLLPRCGILATDVSAAALEAAAEAQYTDWSFRGGEIGSDPRYFHCEGGRARLLRRIRTRVRFEVGNLASGPFQRPQGPLGEFDLILCRNVLIYFDPATTRSVARWFHEALNPGGWLITAPADPPLWDHADFELHPSPGGVLYRKPAAPRPPRPAAREPAGARPPGGRLTARTVAPPRTAARRPAGDKPAQAAPTADAWAGQIRAQADAHGSGEAEAMATRAIGVHPTSPALRYLHAILLTDLGRWDEALVAARKALYLDGELVAGYLLLGSLLRRQGQREGALRAYRNALQLCAQNPPDAAAALTDGETFGALAAAAAAEITRLQAEE